MPRIDLIDRDALHEALAEIRRIERRLRAEGDLATLKRFGNPEQGAAIAASLGHQLLTTTEARVVDQLSSMPGSIRLVRDYLRFSGVPHVSTAGPAAVDEPAPAAKLPRSPARRPARSGQGSRS